MKEVKEGKGMKEGNNWREEVKEVQEKWKLQKERIEERKGRKEG